MAWMQSAEGVQRQQAESLFHDVVTDLPVCQSLEVTIEIRRTRKKTAGYRCRRPRRGVRGEPGVPRSGTPGSQLWSPGQAVRLTRESTGRVRAFPDRGTRRPEESGERSRDIACCHPGIHQHRFPHRSTGESRDGGWSNGPAGGQTRCHNPATQSPPVVRVKPRRCPESDRPDTAMDIAADRGGTWGGEHRVAPAG